MSRCVLNKDGNLACQLEPNPDFSNYPSCSTSDNNPCKQLEKTMQDAANSYKLP